MSQSKYTQFVTKPLNKRINTLLGIFKGNISFKQKGTLISYYIKRLLKQPVSESEKNIYYLYSFLVDSNAQLIEEYKDEYKVKVFIGSKANEIYLRKFPSSDQWVYSQVFIYRQYQPVIDMMLKEYTKDSQLTIIDAGANVGMSTLYFKSIFPNAKIISIEPESGNFQRLKKNIAVNDFADIISIQSALWYREAYLAVIESGDKREWAFSVEETEDKSLLKGYDVAYYIKQLNTDKVCLLKIDIEGAERYLFDNREISAKLLSSCEYLAIEIHDNGSLRKKIYSFLEESGFEYIDSDELTIAKKIHYEQ
ncbi:FkbM family methyltransferase [Cytophagaceae bacterium YF14B1]|uniref:FkbM family methyltransferase n=1 Tax=Xanthocytophaga flava TaxID=3048013 RepID=A0AAE3QWP0_9BACT|nr:FkbM family methyltransferase [Xanthocytophaga flavus]MDJ1484880.1 FkbM family methyltransferase [Xanthocytophaga flavus]